MSGSPQEPWSNDPDAPQIPYSTYLAEKSALAGVVTGAISYGIVVVLFFQCMSALVDPANHTKKGFKWLLVFHTLVMFSCITVFTAISLNGQSISYVGNREYPGAGSVLPPGPLAYLNFIHSRMINVIPNLMFVTNQWLADGLLLYRCYIVYAMNYYAITFPCVLYLASLVTGTMIIYYQTSQRTIGIGTSYLSISVSLNILLTLMIVARLVLHNRNIRDDIGPFARVRGLYKAVIIMFIESSAPYALSYTLFIGTWAAGHPFQFFLFPILAEVQVITPLLIVLRVANRRALTNNMTVSVNSDSIDFMGQGKPMSGRTLPDGNPTMDTYEGAPPNLTGSTTINSHPNKV